MDNRVTKGLMAKFLNTSATNYYLEELIKNATDKIILISPFLKLNDRIKELLEDKNRLKIDIRIVYGKSELQPAESRWLKDLEFVRTSYCKNLHAKCYLNESSVIITSMNLYEFSQVNNNEMGINIDKDTDQELYQSTLEECQRIIRISEAVKITLEPDENKEDARAIDTQKDIKTNAAEIVKKITSSKIAGKSGLKTTEFLDLMIHKKFLESKEGKNYLTDKGKQLGAEFKYSKQHGVYFIWPESIDINKI